MASPKKKYGLLLTANVACGLTFALAAQPVQNNIGVGGLLALTFANAALVGIWGGLGATRPGLRFPTFAAGIGCLSSVFGPVMYFPANGYVSLLLIDILIVTAVFVVLRGLRYSRRRLRLVHLENYESPASEAFQFSIRDLFRATAIVAIVFGLGRALRPIWLHSAGISAIAIFPCLFILVELATLWAALGIGRPAPRLAVVVPTAFVVGTIPVFYLGVPRSVDLADYFFWAAVAGSQAIITAASLLVVRSCGWRLVRGDGLRVDEARASFLEFIANERQAVP